MESWQVFILAIVQGIAEFLPISSSGHLVIVASLFGKAPEELDLADINIVLHMGTLGSILVFYRTEILRMLSTDMRVIPLLVVGTIPAAVLGILVKKKFPFLLESPMLAGAMLLITGVILLIINRKTVGTQVYTELGYAEAIKIGCAQAFALLPGISRSGTTIAAGLAHGLTRTDAAAFSFLLAIPAIGGASLLEILDIREAMAGGEALSTDIRTLLMGAAVAFFVGLAALWWLKQWLDAGRLDYFGYWCMAVGTAVLIWKSAAGS